jgi:hypothetical protein
LLGDKEATQVQALLSFVKLKKTLKGPANTSRLRK